MNQKKYQNTLVIIDMQNVSLENEPFGCLNMDTVSNNIIELINSNIFDKIVFTKFIAPINPIGSWNKYNEKYKEINNNPYLNEIVYKLLPYTKQNSVIEKNTYSCYGNKEFRQIAYESENIILTGVIDDCCIISTMYGGIDRGDNIIMLTDAISGMNAKGKEVLDYKISTYSDLHIKGMTCQEYIGKNK